VAANAYAPPPETASTSAVSATPIDGVNRELICQSSSVEVAPPFGARIPSTGSRAISYAHYEHLLPTHGRSCPQEADRLVVMQPQTPHCGLSPT
jgi:hypothetical protein